ncbi:MAG: hypothetical protein HYW88_01195, partial [Candidatus Sungbacteria bacterium]|nr:hypothetical protein [Candidatus Sungbacteria bacterium]
MANKSNKKIEMTMDKLAHMTAREFSVIRKNMDEGFLDIRKEMVTKDYLENRLVNLKEDMHDIVRDEGQKVIQSNDKVV